MSAKKHKTKLPPPKKAKFIHCQNGWSQYFCFTEKPVECPSISRCMPQRTALLNYVLPVQSHTQQSFLLQADGSTIRNLLCCSADSWKKRRRLPKRAAQHLVPSFVRVKRFHPAEIPRARMRTSGLPPWGFPALTSLQKGCKGRCLKEESKQHEHRI